MVADPSSFVEYGGLAAAVGLMWHLAHSCATKTREAIDRSTEAMNLLREHLRGGGGA